MDRFPALATVSALLKVLAGLIVLVGFFGGIRVGDGGQMIAIWILAAVNALFLFAFAELIGVFLAIEDNTRQSAENTRQTHNAVRSVYAEANSSSQHQAPTTARSKPHAPGAAPSWLKPQTTTLQTGWSAIDEAERRGSR